MLVLSAFPAVFAVAITHPGIRKWAARSAGRKENGGEKAVGGGRNKEKRIKTNNQQEREIKEDLI